jgi:transcriptional regulator with XRE-family HTH domain
MLTDIETFYAALAKRIKSARLKRGLSQDIVANHLGLTKTSIINLEKARHRPSIYQLLQLAELLQISYADLILENNAIAPLDVSLNSKKKIINDIERAITEQGPINKSSRKAVFDFLSGVKS